MSNKTSIARLNEHTHTNEHRSYKRASLVQTSIDRLNEHTHTNEHRSYKRASLVQTSIDRSNDHRSSLKTNSMLHSFSFIRMLPFSNHLPYPFSVQFTTLRFVFFSFHFITFHFFMSIEFIMRIYLVNV